jgi:hypothetical protein
MQESAQRNRCAIGAEGTYPDATVRKKR